jgi:dual-action HEIGH metallo-peptidase
LLAFVLVSIVSCSKKDLPKDDNQTNTEIKEITSYLVSQGLAEKDIVFTNDGAIIQGDIMLTMPELRERVATMKKADGDPSTEHWRGNYIVSNTYNTNIRFYIEPSVPAAWRTAVQGAVNNWNAVNGTRLGMSIITSASGVYTRVFMGNEAANWVARAYLPGSNQRPGTSIEINANFNNMAASQKLFAITHEMGHTIGLLHTNQTQGIFIPGTPSTDANSVMNSFVLNWNGFTAGDVTATQILYPQ